MRLLLILTVFVSACHGDFYRADFGPRSYTDALGFDVRLNRFIVDKVAAETYELKVIGQWQAAMDHEAIKCDVRKAISPYGPLLSWQPFPFLLNGIKESGATTFLGYGAQMRVGWRDDVATTALGHEMGHVILYACQQNPSEDNLSSWAKREGLPY